MTDYLTVRQVADRAQLCEHTIRRAIRAGKLRAFRHGQRLRIREDDAVAWIEAVPVTVERSPVPVPRRSGGRVRPGRGSYASLMAIDRQEANDGS